ncbi:hypothetical protein BS78_K214700 [Paspalum vaginatum]|uniref:Uncharacterized protein n=1 Tax=Paspalum vaginatum TaxID=158149 RepID=A0A9W7XAR5_9POAL|nr:hypothetical protein BS78_K214700 [Paspalum vaginatum]
MAEQEHELWINCSGAYNLDKFREDMSALIIWGTSQAIDVWVVDSDSDAKWKLRRNEHFEKMLQSRLNDRFAKLVVEVITKDGYDPKISSGGSKATSGVTSQAVPGSTSDEGFGDTHTSPIDMEFTEIDWDSLVIMPEPDEDGDPKVLVEEDRIYEAMGFMEPDDRQQQRETREETAAEVNIEEEMREAGVDVNDTAVEEPVQDWDMENLDVSVGSVYPCMHDFRMALRQHVLYRSLN